MTAFGGRYRTAISKACSTSSTRRFVTNAHPTIRRLHASNTTKLRNPADVGT